MSSSESVDAIAIIVDCETNSLDDPECVELAWKKIVIFPKVSGSATFDRWYKPSRPFDAGAVATHFLFDDIVKDGPPSSKARDDLPYCEYIIGHNVDFDAGVLGVKDDVRRICTLALSRHLWPAFKTHKLAAVFLELREINSETVNRIRNAHSAIADVDLCEEILVDVVAKSGVKTFEELWMLSEVARIPTRMMFGKHKGELIADVPRDYKTWLLKQPDVDQYLRKALTAGPETRSFDNW